MAWRLGIDLGTNSLGWAALDLRRDGEDLTPIGLMDSGSRIFSDGRNPKDKQSNAAKRREPRSARKNRDRSKRRSARLMRELIEFGLMPADEKERKALEGGKNKGDKKTALCDSDPWILRTCALYEQITPYQLGRAIFHLHQRRGFKSNRKTDRADGKESGKVYDATKRTKDKMQEAGAKTLGELFGRPRLEAFEFNKTAKKGERKPQPLARVRKSGEGAKWQYDYYPTRELVLEEFDKMWESQKKYYDRLSEKAYNRLRDTIEWQHPLKAQPVGKCTLIPEEPRAPKALPSSQRARIFQEVNALRIMPAGKVSYALNKDQRDIITNRLLHPTNKTGKLSFTQIRKLKNLSIYDSFNTESEKRKELQGDETAAQMMQENRWGQAWFDLSLKNQDEIIWRIIDEENEDVLVAWLQESYGFDKEQAERIADCPLPSAYGNLSEKALSMILPPLVSEVIVYSEAVKKAGFESHSQFGTGEIFDEGLPYYGEILERSVAFSTGDPKDMHEKRYGKIANPTVHVALNQIRAVVNDLMLRFGAPEQIVIELARDLPLSAKGKGELEKTQSDNQKANEKRRDLLLNTYKQSDSYENRMRLRLYEDLEALGKRCVYTGEQIGAHNLFSSEVEIEHILPFSRTLDDGYANKTLSMQKANRDKGNQTPFEAFGHSPDEYDWEEISKRAAELPPSKRWRFNPDAMERFEKDGGFLARQLNDTRYISRLAKGYLEAIYGGQGHEGSKNHVWVINGRLTADLRWQWGLDSILHGHNLEVAEAQKKNRHDHRHHAIDAIVIACTDRKMLKQAADAAKEQENKFDDRLMKNTKEPWDNFRSDVEDCVRNIIVSHKPDHGFQGAMHNDTAYGIAKGEEGKPNKKGVRAVVTRKPLDSDSFKSCSDLDKIRDDIIRKTLQEVTYGLSGKDFKQALLQTAKAMKPPVYKVRVIQNLNVIPFKNKKGEKYKAYKGDSNYCYDIWLNEKGKWEGEVISTFDAYQLSRKDKNWWQKLRGQNEQELIMRIRKNDYLQIEHEGRKKIVQIVKFTNGQFAMAEHFEANVDARTRDKDDDLKFIFKSPSSLQSAKAKRVTISPSGKVNIYQ